MQNWLLLLSYDGFNYHGWQIQTIHNTIEAELEKAIATITGETIKVLGAGRTDAKVHALNQTASFSSNTPFSAERWRNALNGVLPSDIIVKCVLPIPADFHARHSATGKRYRYLIHNRPYPTPFSPHFSWWVKPSLDLNAMQQAASHFLGEHDFSAFRASQCSSPSAIKTIRELTLSPIDTSIASLCIEIEANSFLQHMVRIIVGTLVDVGTHRFLPEDIPRILQNKDRQKSGKTAPPYGLYVLRVYYENGEIAWPPEAVNI